MTCHDARDQLSALLDDALDAAERQTLDAHLVTCSDCRRELAELRATVARLAQLPAARAPAGFVDQVMARAYRPPWPRRLLDALFVPLRVKLPLEAAAVLLVGVSAVYVYQHTPEVRELARQEARESSPAPTEAPATVPSEPVATPPAPKAAPGPTPVPSKDRAREVERASSEEGAASEAKRNQVTEKAAREEPRQTPPVVAQRPPSAPQAPSAPAAPPSDARGAFTGKKEALVEQRSDALGKTAPPAGPENVAQPAEPSAARDAAAAGARAAPSAAAPVPAAPPAAASAPEAQSGVGGAAPAPTTPPATPPATGGAAGQERSPAKSRVAARLMRAVDASGRLTVPARAPAERALDALLARLGAARVGRLLEGDRGMIVIDVLVPGPRYRELIEGLGQIGRWVTEYESGTLPAQVRVEVALTVEP